MFGSLEDGGKRKKSLQNGMRDPKEGIGLVRRRKGRRKKDENESVVEQLVLLLLMEK